MFKQLRAFSGATVLSVAALTPCAALAQASEPWQFGAQIYGYFPSLSGKSVFPAGSNTSSVNIDVDRIIDSIKFVFMGSLEAKKGRWGAFTDVIYMDIGTNKSGTRDIVIGGSEIPAGASASLNYDLKGLIWTVAGEYEVVRDPAAHVDVFVGARMADLEQNINWGLDGNIASIPTPDHTGSSNASRTEWDGIVGAKGRWYFSGDRRWFIPWYADIGTGDSDVTWQLMGGVGYSWQSIDVVGAWRYLKYEFGSGRPFEDLSFSGPSLAVAFRW
ncbi:MAG: hypothetical protein IPI87_08910 [Betaproteobacteria bacterium]|nr:hypothetical protein [Betaproteobacteria bacterium]